MTVFTDIYIHMHNTFWLLVILVIVGFLQFDYGMECSVMFNAL